MPILVGHQVQDLERFRVHRPRARFLQVREPRHRRSGTRLGAGGVRDPVFQRPEEKGEILVRFRTHLLVPKEQERVLLEQGPDLRELPIRGDVPQVDSPYLNPETTVKRACIHNRISLHGPTWRRSA